MQKKFEIEPGIIISKLDIKKNDVIIIIIDLEKYYIEEAYNLFKIAQRKFPDNIVVITFKGIEITAGTGPNPK